MDSENAIRRLCEAIDYPEPVPDKCTSFSLRVDGGDVSVFVRGAFVILSKIVSRRENDVQQLAVFASGRILKEEAVLAWDERASACILWQEVPASAEYAEMKRCFETFMNSCDWWQARIAEIGVPPTVFPDIMIRP